MRWPLLFAALALLYLFPAVLHSSWIPFPPHSPFTDLLISHLPNAEYVRASLARYGQLPLWNSLFFGGQPFAADPLAGLWYPPAWLVLLWPLPITFNWLWGLHLAWAGFGLFQLLRAEGLEVGPAVLGGAAFAGTPKLVAHLGAGHVSLVFAVAWTPWLLLTVRRAAREGGFWPGALAGATLGLTFLTDPRWVFYAGWLGVVYWLAQGRRATKERCAAQLREMADGGAYTRGMPSYKDGQLARPMRAYVGQLAPVACVLFAGLVSAGLALPLLEFMQMSMRGTLTASEAGLYSLPPFYLLGLLIPALGGFHEYMTYVGVFTLLLALLGVSRRRWFWLAAAVLAAGFSFGTNFVVFPLLFRLAPGLSWLRVPARGWFVVALALCALAGHGAQALMDAWPQVQRRYAALKVRLPSAGAVLIALVVLTAVDLARVDYTLIEMRPRSALTEAAAWLKAQPGLFRVYSPSYSLPPGDGLEHVDGVDPLQLAATVAYLEVATGIPRQGYSVTMPPFGEGDLAIVNANSRPDADRMGRLSVKYVVAEFALDAPGLRLVKTFGRTRIYQNEAWRPRAWLDGSVAAQPVVGLASPNRIDVRANGPGRLVLAEMAYPGWQVTVDGRSTSLEVDEGLLRAVSLGPGEHRVVFSFRPLSLYVGAGLTLLGCLALLALAWRRLRMGDGL